MSITWSIYTTTGEPGLGVHSFFVINLEEKADRGKCDRRVEREKQGQSRSEARYSGKTS